MSLLSYAGKLALLNSIITSLAIYPMGTLRLPPKILAQLDKIRRHCLWNKRTPDGDKNNFLAAWDMVCRPKKCGGLGVLNLKVQNDALILKVLHKFYNRLDIPWVQLIWDTYYADSVPHAVDTCGSFWWRELIQLMPVYRGITQIQVKCGSSTLFWKDNWNQAIYAEKYLRAFSYVSDEYSSVREFLTASTLHTTFHLPLSLQAHEEFKLLQAKWSQWHWKSTMIFGPLVGDLRLSRPRHTTNSSSEILWPTQLFVGYGQLDAYPR